MNLSFGVLPVWRFFEDIYNTNSASKLMQALLFPTVRLWEANNWCQVVSSFSVICVVRKSFLVLSTGSCCILSFITKPSTLIDTGLDLYSLALFCCFSSAAYLKSPLRATKHPPFHMLAFLIYVHCVCSINNLDFNTCAIQSAFISFWFESSIELGFSSEGTRWSWCGVLWWFLPVSPKTTPMQKQGHSNWNFFPHNFVSFLSQNV